MTIPAPTSDNLVTAINQNKAKLSALAAGSPVPLGMAAVRGMAYSADATRTLRDTFVQQLALACHVSGGEVSAISEEVGDEIRYSVSAGGVLQGVLTLWISANDSKKESGLIVGVSMRVTQKAIDSWSKAGITSKDVL